MNSTTRRLSIVFAAVAAVGLAACGDKAPEGASAPAADTAAKTPAAAAAKPRRSYPSGMFEHPASSGLRTGGQCALDRMNKEPVGAMPYATGDEILFAGWFVPPAGVTASPALLVLDDGSRQFAHEVKTGGKRPDVATRLNRPDAAGAGYNARVSLSGVPAGEYTVWLAQEGEGGFRCPTKKTITVTG